ncbi:MAG: SDR family NAD(P)-dependent oxidoreductase [Acidimicrobiales bacterium]
MADLDPLASFRLDGRTAIVTGASSGLGARFVDVLHAAGANVIGAARRVDRVRDLVAALPRAEAVACDVSREDDLQRLVDTTIDRFGAVDILVNNAGAKAVAPAVDETPEQLRTVIDVNLIAACRLSQLAGRVMIDQGRGAIVNISSMLGVVASGQIPQVGYVSSKSGLLGATREFAVQWARKGVRVNAIAPGWFPSEMTEDMTTNEDGGLRWIRSRDPMGRPGREDELDGALLFLASDASSYVTGQVLTVDGGWTIV